MRIKDYLWRERRRLRRAWQHYRDETALDGYSERGHFYSPLPNLVEAAEQAAYLAGQPEAAEFAGISLRISEQKQFLETIAELYSEFDWSEEQRASRRFYLGQGYYKEADSLALYTVLRTYRPRRVIEVGSGFTSALLLDVSDQHLEGETRFTFIDPHPERLDSILRPADASVTTILRRKVQGVSEDVFRVLQSNDILFIDSSHVSKAGSDLNYLMFNVIPILQPGVLIHFHDIYWPFEYPAAWLQQGHAWNECYLIRAFLLFNADYEVVFWTPFAAKRWPQFVAEKMPLYLKNTGASLWLRRTR